jgi:hypothetical protein
MPEQLTDFLLERIADEENLAHDAASEGTPHRTGWQLWTSKVDTTPGGERLGPRGSVEASPARVLAEAETKRGIVAEHQITLEEVAEGRWEGKCSTCFGEAGIVGDRVGADPQIACPTLKLLAVPYADHPDYQPEWRP